MHEMVFQVAVTINRESTDRLAVATKTIQQFRTYSSSRICG